MDSMKVLVFEYPLPCGGQLKVSAHGMWSDEDCDTVDEFMPLVVRSMRRSVEKEIHNQERENG